MFILKSLFFLLFFIVVSCNNDITEKEELKTKLQNLINKEITVLVPGIQLSIKHPNLGVISVASGQANIKENINLTITHSLRIASATKIFTAVLIMKLVENKIININDTMKTLLPNLEFKTANIITLKDLLQHTTGFKGYFNDDDDFQEYVIDNPKEVYSPEILFKKALNLHTPIESEINDEFHYTNTNYIILGMIIEKYFNKSYKKCVEEEIINPLSLKNTLAINDISEIKDMAEGYFFIDNTNISGKKYNHSFLFSAGNIISRTSDLVEFIDALMKNKLISKETLSIMKKYINTSSEDLEYGFGLGNFKNLGVGHNGLTLGYTSIVIYNKELNLSIAVLINALSKNASPIEIAKKVLIIIKEL